MRYKITIEYNGIGFHGWQKQKNLLTVQGSIEEAIFKFSGEVIELQGGGRTDKGVHARGQVAHFDLKKLLAPLKIREAINYYLRPLPISILTIEEVSQNFNARFDAKARIYLYKIINRPCPLTVDKFLAWHVIKELDVEKLKNEAKFLIGMHDFSSFRDSKCQAKSPVKTLDSIEINKKKDAITLVFKARSFLHSQVRIMVGALKASVSSQKFNIHSILNDKNRQNAGAPAPPHGLYLMKIIY